MPKRTRSNTVEAFLRRLSSQAFTITGEAVTNAAGAAGTVQDFNLAIGPITNSFGNDLGAVGDTSIALTHLAFTTEVAPKADADLANGEFYVDYLTGKARGKKATTDTSGTVNYKAFAMRSTVALGDGTNTVPVETAGADAVSNTSNRLPVSSRGHAFNGTTWDRIRSGVITPSTTLTGMQNTLNWAIFNAAPTTRTEGQGGPLQGNAVGDLNVTQNTRTAGERTALDYLLAVPAGTPTPITTATTTLVKTGSGVLTELMIGKRVANGVITIYDALTATGTPIFTSTAGAALLTDPPYSVAHGVVFNIGLCIVTSAAEFITPCTI